MLKAIIGLSITILLMVTAGVVMGFVYLFQLTPLWFGITSLSVYVALLLILGILIYVLLGKIKISVDELIEEIKTFIKNTVEQIKNLTPRQIFAIIMKILKK